MWLVKAESESCFNQQKSSKRKKCIRLFVNYPFFNSFRWSFLTVCASSHCDKVICISILHLRVREEVKTSTSWNAPIIWEGMFDSHCFNQSHRSPLCGGPDCLLWAGWLEGKHCIYIKYHISLRFMIFFSSFSILSCLAILTSRNVPECSHGGLQFPLSTVEFSLEFKE